ncbi:xaa-Pro aminopeptidase 3 isoform X1 [Acyrthosiphon pisum]|uniref:Aminopeptidase P N-terminal domain-containing protein n=2 Tax=Acyrthosiphon pisum TaxID=7029 RepID=A0A8R2FCN4_ACYPI|nr:xaa-Pro aminopeptidase 3 isoform X1 [Acyrthosiphon pisum]|eukprot:XP_008187942.1 PREDICTED: probable Xaa-Pro aminopeptidase 3 isoform X1 [Acyrthosiphon pisum]
MYPHARLLCLSNYAGKLTELWSNSSRCIHQMSMKNIVKTPLICGQPTYESHPHLVMKGELVPGIQKEEFTIRRRKLMESVLSTRKDFYHVIVIPSAIRQYMSDHIPYPFRQNTDFLYFSGCQETDSALVLCGNSVDNFTSTLFVKPYDLQSELWNGPSTRAECASLIFGVDDGKPLPQLSEFIMSELKGHKNCVLWYNQKQKVQSVVDKTINNAAAENSIYLDDSLVNHCHKLRLYKSLAEQRLMRQSCKIASKAFIEAMMSTKPGSTEHELYARLDFECRMGGAEYLAYPPVVAAGNNANTLHYIDNKQKIKDGDLILVDAGCEYHGYSSDISRTWPANGWFSDAQKTLYEATLCVQKELIDMCQARPSLDTLYEAMCFKLGKALAAAHVFKKNVDPSELNMLARALCPHHVSHYLGMDVHDIGTIKKSIKTEPGFIITVEPGVYVSKNNIRVHEEFLGLGIRIEDDVLITENSIEVLSEDCPKEIVDIERIMSRQPK